MHQDVDQRPELVAIWIKRAKRGVMDSVQSATAITGRGLLGNANQGGRRQVTIIEEAAWREAQRALGVNVPPAARRANLLVRGVSLEATAGRTLRVGHVLIRVWGETRPCYQMDEAEPGLRRALEPHWQAGVSGEILQGGELHVGDAVEWVDDAQSVLRLA